MSVSNVFKGSCNFKICTGVLGSETVVQDLGRYTIEIPVVSATKADLEAAWTSLGTGSIFTSLGILNSGWSNIMEMRGAEYCKFPNLNTVRSSSPAQLGSPYALYYYRTWPKNTVLIQNDPFTSGYLFIENDGSGFRADDLSSGDGFYDGTNFASLGAALYYGVYRRVGSIEYCGIGGMCITSDGFVHVYSAYINKTNSNSRFFSREVSTKIIEWLEELPAPQTDPYSGLGDDPIGGGTVPIPGLPPISAVDTGIIGLFSPSAAQMRALADFMWTDFGGEGTTIEEILEELVQAIKRSISNPLDYILGLNIIPSQGLSIGESKIIRFGFLSSGVSMPALSNQYFIVDCGSIFFDTVCGDTFLDYAPYSKFSIYLPYIGFKEVDANDFVGHDIGVIYHGDTVTGAVVAYITKDGSVMYQYSGDCALTIPLAADSWSETISGALNIAATAIGAGVASGAAAAPAGAKAKEVARSAARQEAIKGDAAISAANTALNPSMLGPQVTHSGAVSGGAGAMGVQYPFVIREAVRFHSTDGFNTLAGYPSHYFRRLGDMSGYTSVIAVHLVNMPATQDEIDEIEGLLIGGVII